MALTNDMAVAQDPKSALSQHWWFRLLLLVGALFIPPITEVRFSSADTSKLIAAVLSHPLIVEVSALLPLAKVLLLLALLCAFRWRQAAPQILLGYYVVALVVTGVLQNMGHTDVFGFAWLTGNTFIMLVLAVQCAWEVLQLRATPEPFVLPTSPSLGSSADGRRFLDALPTRPSRNGAPLSRTRRADERGGPHVLHDHTGHHRRPGAVCQAGLVGNPISGVFCRTVLRDRQPADVVGPQPAGLVDGGVAPASGHPGQLRARGRPHRTASVNIPADPNPRIRKVRP